MHSYLDAIALAAAHFLFFLYPHKSSVHNFQEMHTQAKEKIHDFVRGHFHG